MRTLTSLGRSLSLRVLVLVLLPLLPLLGFTLFDGIQERQQAEREARRSALRLAKAVSANQQQLIEETRQLLTTLAKDPRLRGASTGCNLYLADMRHRWPRYANFGVIAPNGNLACSALPAAAGVNLGDRLYFQQAVATRDFALGEYQIGRISGKASLNFGYPLLDNAGRVTKVAFAALDLSWLNALAGDARLASGTVLVVVDRRGTILAHYPDPGRWVGRSAGEEAPVRAVLAGEEGTAEANGLDGAERLYGFTPLPGGARATPVYVYAGVPKSAALAPATRDLRRDLSVVGLVALLALVAGWLGGRLLVVRPVVRREQAVRAEEETLASFGERLSVADGDDLATVVLTGIADVAEADVGALYLAEDDDGALLLASSRGLDASNLPARLAPGEGRAGRALAEKRAVLTPADPSLRLVVLGAELPVRHELDLPLFHDDRGLGVVMLGRATNGPFTPDQVELLGFLAMEAGTALSARNANGSSTAREPQLSDGAR